MCPASIMIIYIYILQFYLGKEINIFVYDYLNLVFQVFGLFDQVDLANILSPLQDSQNLNFLNAYYGFIKISFFHQFISNLNQIFLHLINPYYSSGQFLKYYYLFFLLPSFFLYHLAFSLQQFYLLLNYFYRLDVFEKQYFLYHVGLYGFRNNFVF